MKKSSQNQKRTKDASDYSDISKKIKPVETLPFSLTLITYGRPGTGKTTFAATFPKPILLLNVKEDGTDSISDVKGIDTVKIDTWDEFEQTYWYVKAGKHKYKTVVIDAVTQLQDLAIEKHREGRPDDEVISQRIWGQVSGMMKKWLVEYRDLVNVGGTVEAVNFICHDRVHDTDDTGGSQLDPEVGPRLMPSVAGHLCGAVKVIGYTFIKETKQKDPTKKNKGTKVEYRMRLGPHPYYTTKVRQPKSSFTPDSIVNPSYDKIVQIMKGEYKQK